MSGIRRLELLNLDCLEMTDLLEGTLTKETLKFFKDNNIDGNTLAILERDDVNTCFGTASIPVKVNIIGFLRKLDNAEKTYSKSIIASPIASQSAASTISELSSEPSLASEDLTLNSQPFTQKTKERVAALTKKYTSKSDSTSTCSERTVDNTSVISDSVAKEIPKDLPKDFRLPNQFGRAIDEKLKDKTPGSLPSDMRNRIIRQVETTVSVYNNKPSPYTVEWLAKSLCTTYPSLQQIDPRSGFSEDSSTVDGVAFKNWMLLKKQLQKRFENSRVTNKKMESTSGEAPPAKKLKLSLKKDLKVSCRTESDEELQKHDAILQKEMKKSKPNIEAVSQLMEKLFDTRKKFIRNMDAKFRIIETVKNYPCLQWQLELQNEMVRVLKSEGQTPQITLDQIKENWNVQAQRLKAFAKYKGFFNADAWEDIYEDQETQDMESDDEHQIAFISDFQLLQVLPSIFPDGKNAKSNFFLQEAGDGDPCPKERGRTSPYLLCSSLYDEEKRQVWVMANQTNYMEIEKPCRAVDAVMALMAIYYVYNFNYPPEVRSTFIFLQEFILGDHLSSSRKQTKYLSKLNEYLSFVNSHI